MKKTTKIKKLIKKTTKRIVKKTQEISKDITFSELLNKYPETANTLFESGLHCIGCGGAMYETIEQGCQMHGFSKKQIDDLIKKLNEENKK